MRIRKATENDLTAIQGLNAHLFKFDSQFDNTLKLSWSFDKEGETYFRQMIKSEFCYVAEEPQGEIVGYLAGSFINKCTYGEEYAELENMYVSEKYRNHKIGSKLLSEFFEQCKRKNINAVRVTASVRNDGALAFYKKNGFDEFDMILRKKLN